MTILDHIFKDEYKEAKDPGIKFRKKRHEIFLEKVLSRFNRYDASKISEDCIRYDYFDAVIKCGSIFERPLLEAENGVDSYDYNCTDLILEYPHPDSRYIGKKNKEKKIDCVVMQLDAKAGASGKDVYKPVDTIELKFFPETESKGTAKTQHIASLVADFQRLRDAKKLGTRLVVLVTLDAMITYINGDNGFSTLFSEKEKNYKTCKISVDKQDEATFRKVLDKRTYKGVKLTPITVERIFFESQTLESGPNKNKEIAIAAYIIKG